MDSPGFFPVNVAGENSNASFDHWVARDNSYRMHGGNAEYTNDDWLITQPLNLVYQTRNHCHVLKSSVSP